MTQMPDLKGVDMSILSFMGGLGRLGLIVAKATLGRFFKKGSP